MNAISDANDIAVSEALLREPHPDLEPVDAPVRPFRMWAWVFDDSPYIAMLLLALIGVAVHPPVVYWMIMSPVFACICIVAGWRHFRTQEGHNRLLYSQILEWLAIIIGIGVLYSTAVQGVLNTNASALAMLTLLALGAFMAGLQARVWRVCATGAILFLAVPFVAWLDQSVMLLVAALAIVLLVGGLTWWVGHRRYSAA